MATFTYESIVNKFKNVTLSGNLDLLDDSAIVKLGADDDLQITHSGSAATITNTTGDTTLDLAGDLIIDVDGADVLLKDASTQFGAFSNSSGHLQIKDGTTTFLTGAGAAATFASTLAVTGVLTADAGVNIDNITIDGTEIDLSSGDLTIDSAGDIILDADGGDVFVKDAGTTYGSLTNSSGNLIIKSGTTTAATFSGANVTIAGTTTSSGNLSTSGTLTVAGTSDLNGNIDVAGTIVASGDITAFSSEVLKDDIRTIDNALNKVADMRGVYFTKDGEAGTGVIAEEVEAVLPEVVKDGKYKSVAYGNIVGVLIEAVKELKEEVTSLKENS
ncbi:tail fiber domain-containing protein [Pelagibacterales bacterium]|nr:tail fiber domain-containing protein [Pelagibacterales bacterium]